MLPFYREKNMLNIKKLLCAVCGAELFAVILSGCSAEGSKADNEADSSLQILKIGIDNEYEPYTYIDENGELTGIDIDLAKEACRRLGRRPEFMPVKWDSKKESLKAGDIDCIWSCLSMTGRENEYSWAGPYMNSRIVIVVDRNSDIDTISDLKNKRVAVMTGTKPEELLLDEDDPDIPDIEKLYVFDNMEVAVASLRKGYADAASGHEIAIQKLIGNNGYYRVLDDALETVKVGVAFDKDDPDEKTRDELTEILREMNSDGTAAQIIEKYGYDSEHIIAGLGLEGTEVEEDAK